MTYCNVDADRFIWMLNTSFVKSMFFITSLTWGLIIVALILLVMLLVRKVFFEDYPRKQVKVRSKK